MEIRVRYLARVRRKEPGTVRVQFALPFKARVQVAGEPDRASVPYGMRNVDVPFALQNMVDGHLQNAVPGPVPEQDVSVHFHFFLFREEPDRKSTRLNSSHQIISYAVF